MEAGPALHTHTAGASEALARCCRLLGRWGGEAEAKEATADLDLKRRRLIEELDLTVRLAVEDGQKVVRVKCLVGYDALPILLTKS